MEENNTDDLYEADSKKPASSSHVQITRKISGEIGQYLQQLPPQDALKTLYELLPPVEPTPATLVHCRPSRNARYMHTSVSLPEGNEQGTSQSNNDGTQSNFRLGGSNTK
ncbi:MAG TPA: hypothetical protein VGV92_08320 [Gammaproteobacteria bacterium]|nr:hypothetical protein [Gammaproteobacteria bacterium]